MFGVQQVHGPAPGGGYNPQQIHGPSPQQIYGAQAYFPMQTNGFDMSTMMNMIMMVMMLAVVMSMLKPIMAGEKST